MFGLLRIDLDLFPDPVDMDHDRILHRISFGIPDIFIDLFGTENMTGILHQKLQDFILGSRN